MWALRRALNPFRSYRYHVGSFRAGGVDLSTLTDNLHRGVETAQTQLVSVGYISGTKCCCLHSTSLSEFSLKTRGISSQAGAESGGEEDDTDDMFSELGKPTSSIIKEKNVEESNEDLLSEPELSDNNEADDKLTEISPNELDFSDTDQNANKGSSSKDELPDELPDIYKVVVSAKHEAVAAALDKWDQEGNSITREDISLTLVNLRRRRYYTLALQFSEWLEARGKLEFNERDYATRVDLIAKLRGGFKAKQCIADIPERFRGEIIYRTLLANTVFTGNLKKAEALFKKMIDLGFSISSFACDQMLMLYKRLDRKKISNVLVFMEKENIVPTIFTYRLLIDTKGQSKDISGMEKLLDSMKEQGLELDHTIQAMLVKHYIRGGLNEKAEAVLKEMEGDRKAYSALLPLYAELGKANEVDNIWKKCNSNTNPFVKECLAAIKAWGKLGKIEEAEAVFEFMTRTWKQLAGRNYTTLLQVYADNKLLVKGEKLVERMADSGVRIVPYTWDALVKLYVEAGELEKADSILEKVVKQKQVKVLFSTYMYLLDQYAKRGDIFNAEKIFHQLKHAGHVSSARQYQSLIEAYINAEAPAYGIRERMKADEVYPNTFLLGKLAQVDAFKGKQRRHA